MPDATAANPRKPTWKWYLFGLLLVFGPHFMSGFVGYFLQLRQESIVQLPGPNTVSLRTSGMYDVWSDGAQTLGDSATSDESFVVTLTHEDGSAEIDLSPPSADSIGTMGSTWSLLGHASIPRSGSYLVTATGLNAPLNLSFAPAPASLSPGTNAIMSWFGLVVLLQIAGAVVIVTTFVRRLRASRSQTAMSGIAE